MNILPWFWMSHLLKTRPDNIISHSDSFSDGMLKERKVLPYPIVTLKPSATRPSGGSAKENQTNSCNFVIKRHTIQTDKTFLFAYIYCNFVTNFLSDHVSITCCLACCFLDCSCDNDVLLLSMSGIYCLINVFCYSLSLY